MQHRRILVVEDEYILAVDLQHALEELGATVVGPAGSVADALAILSGESDVDAAVLDVNLGCEKAFPIAEALQQRAVPFVFATGYDEWIIPATYRAVPRLEKPVDTRLLARVLPK